MNTKEQLIARIKELSADTLETAIERGRILKTLNLAWHEYESKKVGISHHTGYRLIQLVDHPRMAMNWEKPCHWATTYEVLQVNDRIFEVMLKAGFLNYFTTRRQVRDFVKAYWLKIQGSKVKGRVQELNTQFENEILCGDCLDLILQLSDNSISAVITSPPYAEQRAEYYESVSEQDYPCWFQKVMAALYTKVVANGSVLVVIRSHVKDGKLSDYVLRTRLAVRESGWIEPEEMIWYKPDGQPRGAVNRPRRNFENILWFSKSPNPFMNLTACGKRSKRIGCTDDGVVLEGTARIPDVFVCPASEAEKGIDHPAIFPPALVHRLVQSFSKPDDLILDPFVGSGTTALVAKSLGRRYLGFDIHPKFVELSNSRLASSANATVGLAANVVNAL